jgi:hypothetical protein
VWLELRAEIPTLRKPRRVGQPSALILPAKKLKGARVGQPADVAGSIRPSVEIDAAHEGEIAAYAVAGNEVGIAR